MQSDLLALAERCEKATGPDRELNAEIWLAINPSWRDYPRTGAGGWITSLGETAPASHYTESIDAALTLVPDGMEWFVSNRGQIGADHLCFAGVFGQPMIGSECDSHGHTAALALCSAALRARIAARAGDT